MDRDVRRMAALLLVVVLMMAGCSTSDDDDGDALATGAADQAAGDGGTGDDGGDETLASTPATEDDAVLERAVQGESAEGAEGGPPAVPDVQTFTFGRDIIFTADLVLTTDDVIGTTERAAVVVEGLGGIVFGQNSQTDPEPRSTVTFKVAPARFQETLLRLGELGEVRSQMVSAEDVTDRVVDLESRIQTAEASVDRLRGFLAGATDLDTITRLEAQLLERETALEQLRGQVRTLENQVALATIVLTIRQMAPAAPEPGFDVAVSAYTGHDSGIGCPANGDLAIDENEPMTVCWSVTNTGDAHLGEVAVGQNQLGVDMDQITVVSGTLAQPTAPGDTVVLAWEVEADPDQVLDSTVRAVPVDEDGERLGLGVQRQTATAELTVDPDDSLPGFADALRASGAVLAFIGSVLVVVAGALVPFLPLLLAGVLLAWWMRRRREAVA